MIPIDLKEAAKAIEGRLLCANEAQNITILDVTTDSRNITPGCMFVALKGEKFDGHDFIEKAFEQGAVCAVASRYEKPLEEKGAVILVEDTKRALLSLAGYIRNLRDDLLVVGVTGSVGKTTTKDMIASVLAQRYTVLKTEGNFNNEIGLALTLFRLTKEHEVAVLEMGMNHFGEIHHLTMAAHPNIAVITNIGVSHIENLGSREGIRKAKSEIFDSMDQNSVAVLNADDDMLFSLMGRTPGRVEWFGLESHIGIYADEITPMGLEGVKCCIHTGKGSFDAFIPLAGNHMVLNALAAVAVGIHLGMDLEEMKKGILSFVPTKMRMAIECTKTGIRIINDTYNANPVSMKASIDVLSQTQGIRTAILGDMFELGEHAMAMHEEVGEYAAKKGIDRIICIGNMAGYIAKGAKKANGKDISHYLNQEEFLETGVHTITKGTVLVKASRGMHLEKTVEKIREVK